MDFFTVLFHGQRFDFKTFDPLEFLGATEGAAAVAMSLEVWNTICKDPILIQVLSKSKMKFFVDDCSGGNRYLEPNSFMIMPL